MVPENIANAFYPRFQFGLRFSERGDGVLSSARKASIKSTPLKFVMAPSALFALRFGRFNTALTLRPG
jgi:hypothetical protein